MRAHAIEYRVKTVSQTEGDFVSTFSQPDKTTSEFEKIISDLNLFPSQIALLFFTHKIKMVHPTFGVIFMTFILLLIPSTFPVDMGQLYHAGIPLL